MYADIICDRLQKLFLECGFNLFRRINTRDYDRRVRPDRRIINILPDAATLFLVGFGGREFWETLNRFLLENPSFGTENPHWIDKYTALSFESAKERILHDKGTNYRFVFPFGHEGAMLDFSLLGEIGGIGVRSLLGILLNPVYGSWISLRGAVITDFKLTEYDKTLASFNPCPPCSKPCISACPARTISEKGWDHNACMRYRLDYDTCNDNCSSRRACPYGKEHQYSEEQLAYHHKFVLESVRKHFGGEWSPSGKQKRVA